MKFEKSSLDSGIIESVEEKKNFGKIMGCVHYDAPMNPDFESNKIQEDGRKYLPNEIREYINDEKVKVDDSNVTNIDYYKEEDKILSGEKVEFVFDESDKMSVGYSVCLGSVFVGKSKETGENVSFFTHNLPTTCDTDEFRQAYVENLQKAKSLCEEDTMDVVMFAGMIEGENDGNEEGKREAYINGINSIIDSVKEAFPDSEDEDFPSIIIGPKKEFTDGKPKIVGDDVYFDTSNRMLHFHRRDSHDNQSYTPEEFREQYQNNTKRTDSGWVTVDF